MALFVWSISFNKLHHQPSAIQCGGLAISRELFLPICGPTGSCEVSVSVSPAAMVSGSFVSWCGALASIAAAVAPGRLPAELAAVTDRHQQMCCHISPQQGGDAIWSPWAGYRVINGRWNRVVGYVYAFVLHSAVIGLKVSKMWVSKPLKDRESLAPNFIIFVYIISSKVCKLHFWDDCLSIILNTIVWETQPPPPEPAIPQWCVDLKANIVSVTKHRQGRFDQMALSVVSYHGNW